ncbi:MAG: FAD-dependent thymidylate synthase [Candidatus Eremiobacteraeota bacterium]|nr:FAD-dependent thymidylate synthase [Candidatus Eremiobacteraeota bacterium]
MGFSARVLLDSQSPAGARLTTMEVRYPRFIHSELMTHRVFCLDGDTELCFDLPSGGDETKVFKMSIEDFFEKWHFGAAPRQHKARVVRSDGIEPDRYYEAPEAAEVLGYSHYTAVDNLSRRLRIERHRDGHGRYRLKGADLIAYANGTGMHRYSLRGRLKAMRLRTCDEITRLIGHTTVTDVTFSGVQPVFRITTIAGKTIVTSAEHRLFTESGWLTLREAGQVVLSRNNIASWKPFRVAVNGVDPLLDESWLRKMRDRGYSARLIADRLGVRTDQVKYRFRRFGLTATNPSEVWRKSHTKVPWNKGRRYSNIKTRGVPTRATVRRGADSPLWRGGITPERKMIGAWTVRQASNLHRGNGFKCELCDSPERLHAHHLDPVAHNPARAYDVTNLRTVCEACHDALHHRNLELRLLEHVADGGSMRSFWATVGEMRLRRRFRRHQKWARVAHFVDVVAVEYVGLRPTYDLEVAGPFHNFVANGFVVHNSRNAASSRAIPIKKMIDAVRSEPAMPLWWGRNQSGMQAREEISEPTRELAMAQWREALGDALRHAERLSSSDINLHKQLVNRLLEPFAWITVIITATEWANFFTQRTHEDAQPELKYVADLMLGAYKASLPKPVGLGEWHTPLIQPDEEAWLSPEDRVKISVARCGRVSYLTHDGTRDTAKDLELYDRLLEGGANGHWSPFEHVATPLADRDQTSGNFRGWEQYRKRFPEENAASFPGEAPSVTLR